MRASKCDLLYGASEDPEELLEIMLRNRRNSFYVASVSGTGPAGCAVYVTPSFFNHSCSYASSCVRLHVHAHARARMVCACVRYALGECVLTRPQTERGLL